MDRSLLFNRAQLRFGLAGMKTTAVLQGEEWILNGSKTFITNGGMQIFISFLLKQIPS